MRILNLKTMQGEENIMFAMIVKIPELFGDHAQPGDTVEAETLPELIAGLLPGYASQPGDEARYAGRVMVLTSVAMALQMRAYERYEQETGKSIMDVLPGSARCTVGNDQKQAPLEPRMRAWPMEDVPFYFVADTMGDNYPDGLVYMMNAENETLFLRSLVHVGAIEILEKKE